VTYLTWLKREKQINKILYKKMDEDSIVLVVPELLAKQVIFQCHNNLGFHFIENQLKCLLSPLIYHPHLEAMISKIVKKCLICTILAPKSVRNLIGAQRSNYYVPSQCLFIDSCYLPKESAWVQQSTYTC